MADLTLVQRVIRDRINTYQDEYDLWKADHKLAMVYFDFCDLLREGLELYKELCRFDEGWRREVFRQKIPYDPEMAARLDELFKKFAHTALGIEAALLPAFEQHYGVVEGDEFRSCCRELRGILTADGDFFVGDALVSLRDSALDEHAKGDCEPWSA